MGRPDGKKPLGRARRRWENNIEMDLEDLIGHHKVNICNVRFKKEIHNNAILVEN
jgi:hypothetical protein